MVSLQLSGPIFLVHFTLQASKKVQNSHQHKLHYFILKLYFIYVSDNTEIQPIQHNILHLGHIS